MGSMGESVLSRPWRLVLTPPATGPWNMAVDEALFESVLAGGAPVLRFYQWNPGTLSLGRFQNLVSGIRHEGLSGPVVRRMTGGGGIWHSDELTYSLACVQDDVGNVGVKASFERLCSFLVTTWKKLGWEAHFARDSQVSGGPLGRFTPACFAGNEEYDILVNGKKLGGNAQRRDRQGIFQHGSIPRLLDFHRLSQIFLDEACPDESKTTDLVHSGWIDPVEDLIPLLRDSFAECLDCVWVDQGLAIPEQNRAATLVAEKYDTDAWTSLGGGSLRPEETPK